MMQEQPVHFRRAGEIQPIFGSLPPLALYIHIPWCIRKCPYCDFYSNRLTGELDEDGYIAVLQRDIEQALPLIWGRRIISIFIGALVNRNQFAVVIEFLLLESIHRLFLAIGISALFAVIMPRADEEDKKLEELEDLGEVNGEVRSEN